MSGWTLSASASASASSADGSAANPSNVANPEADGNNSIDFDKSFLPGGSGIDLSRFQHGNMVPPGSYNVDIYLNNNWIGRRDVRFATLAGKTSATPCIDNELFKQLGLPASKEIAAAQAALDASATCVGIDSLIPGALSAFDMSALRLDISVPQAYVGQAARGYVDPKYWDAGIPVAFLNYNFNTYRTTSDGVHQTTAYLGLNSGFNVGLWHFRQDSTMTWLSGAGPTQTKWQNIQTYAQHDLPSLGAQLTIGDSYTDGQVYDSFGIRGVQLATDDRMRPDSRNGYAPIVQGVAQTNARVTIFQNGVKLYETTVSPGPFSINDLYATGYGGDLLVTVTEANGQSHSFTVPYASIAQLQRPGITRFDAAVGQLRNLSISHEPTVAQVAVQHGFTNLLTGYAGAAVFSGYANALAGAAVNTTLGAVGMDLSASRTQIPGASTQSGESLRVTYSKIIPSTQTSFSVAAYRYSTSGFLDITDAAVARDYAQRGLDAYTTVVPYETTIDGVTAPSTLTAAQLAALSGKSYGPTPWSTVLSKQRNRFTLSMNQGLGQGHGTLYATASAISYWDRSSTIQYQLGYNNSFRRLQYSLSVQRSRDELGRFDNQVMASFTLPLGDTPHAPTLNTSFTHDSITGMQEQATLNGTWGNDSQFSYGASASHSDPNSDGNSGTAGSINAGYRSPYAIFNASYGAGSGYSQASATISGSILAHSGGVLFGQSLGDTAGIAYIPGAAGATIGNAAGVRVNGNGYALIPYLRPYYLDTITVDPKGLPLDVQLEATGAQVAPHAGAVVLLKFKSSEGRSALMHITLADKLAVPFGAEVFDASGNSLGVVGQGGTVLLRGVKQAGQLSARWQNDNGQAQSCSFSYQLPGLAKGSSKHLSYQEVEATCAAPQTTTPAGRNGP